MPIRAVLFDRDDTIAVTDRGVFREAAQWTAQRVGQDPREVGEALQQLWADTPSWWDLRTEADETRYWQAYLERLAQQLNVPVSRLDGYLDAWPYHRYFRPVPEAREVLTALRRRGLKTGVLSNTFPSIRASLEATQLDDLIDVAISTCAAGVHKPEAGAFLYAAAQLQLPPADILFIDDRLENVEAARQVGMAAELIDLKRQTPGALHQLSDVLQVVETELAGA
ncbi:HAD family phosphatase [Deinococcus sonorensis]|uniref:HAD family phosphatase n=2 Tax=Deinococcus sonorensis TaxID=309891 RepID=A0AAU7UAL1_9DEIO